MSSARKSSDDTPVFTYTFNLMGVDYHADAWDVDNAREDVLIQACNGNRMPLDTELGKFIWSKLSVLEPSQVRPQQKMYYAKVEMLEWNAYVIEVDARSIDDARDYIKDCHSLVDVKHVRVKSCDNAISPYGGREPNIKEIF